MRELFSVMHQLGSVKRFSRDHMLDRESVTEHTGWCGIFAFIVSELIEQHTSARVDYGVLYKRVMAHDVDEAALGDIPRITKYWNAEIHSAFHHAEIEAVQRIADQLGVPALYFAWHTAKDDSLEGCILRLTDIAAVVYKVWTEVNLLGNISFCRVANELIRFLNEVALKLSATLPADVAAYLRNDFDVLREITEAAALRKHGLAL